jgi:hypothetical protein
MKSRSDSPGFWVQERRSPGIPRAHVRALEVAHERADQIIPVVDLAGWQMLKPRPGRIAEV